ncbi:MAG: tetratricopeptide repeat protein [Candidatus Obscuribacterales bacterium]|nr:tetratricopeptide repeat protein [Candidatus Obscuribacterales bacterium]
MKDALRRFADFHDAKLNLFICMLSGAMLVTFGIAQSQEPLFGDQQEEDPIRKAMDNKNYSEAERLLLLRLKQAESMPEVSTESRPNQREWAQYYALASLAEVYCKERKWTDAEATYKRELVINEKLHAFVNENRKDLANCYRMQRKFSQAEPLLRQALTNDEEEHAGETTLAEANQNLAELLIEEGKDAEADAFYKRALKNEMYAGGPFDCHMITDFAVLVRLFKEKANEVAGIAQDKLHQERSGAAAEKLANLFLSKEIESSIKKIDTSHGGPDAALRYTLLAAAYAAEGKSEEAESLLHDALISTEYMQGPAFNGYMLTDQPEPKDPTFGDENPDVAKRLNNIAELCLMEEKYADAETALKRSLKITKATMGEEHPRVATTMELYTQVLRKTGREKEAEELNAKIRSILLPQS